MGNSFGNSLITIIVMLIGVAIIAALVSPKAQTAQVLSAAAGAFSSIIKAAVSPLV
jgi:hypothetical protein